MTRAILTCSGLDKSLGSLAREVAVRAAEALGCEIICPVLLNAVPARYAKLVQEGSVIVIDGCATGCATKLANQVGAKLEQKVLLAEAVKAAGLELEPALTLGPRGLELAQRLVENLVSDLTETAVAAAEMPSLVAPEEYLTVTHDKYQFRIPAEGYAFTENDTWVRLSGPQAFVGISDFLQQEMTDLVYFVPPAVGAEIEQFGELGTLESTKAVFEVIAPISGTVVAVNEALVEQPELANEDPYGAGWVAVLAPQDYAEDAELLLDGAGYAKVVQRKAAEAGR